MLRDFTGAEKVYIACGYTDLRRGIDGLAALVQQQFNLDPFSNTLFLFCGRRRDRIKALYWEGNGFVLLYKRLESGSFQWPRKESEARALTSQQYRWLMEGLSVDQPTTSYGDITRYFAEQGILFHGKELIRPTLAQMLRNPVYVQADLDVYEFFKSQGTVIVNDVADFTGMNGCYLYQGRDVKASKKNDLKDQMLVLAPHEGIVPSDIWLTCRKKLMNNMKIQSARKATHTWLAGKIKCGNCGYALMSIYNPSGKQYLRCTKRLDNKSCPGCGKIITSELEAVVYQQMVKKLASYKTLTGKKKAAKANPKITALQVELAHVDSEIEKLVDSLTGANNVLFSYVNVKIAELDGRKQELLARIAELTVEAISPEQVSQISGYLDTWENVSFDDKRRVVDLMITTIAATSDSLNITWKI